MNHTTIQERQLQQKLKAAEAGASQKRQSKGLLTFLFFMPLVTFATGIYLGGSPKSHQPLTAETTDSTQTGHSFLPQHKAMPRHTNEETLAKTQSLIPISEESEKTLSRQPEPASQALKGANKPPKTGVAKRSKQDSNFYSKHEIKQDLEQLSDDAHYDSKQPQVPRSMPSAVYRTASATVYTTGSSFNTRSVHLNGTNNRSNNGSTIHDRSTNHCPDTSSNDNGLSALHLHYHLNRHQQTH